MDDAEITTLRQLYDDAGEELKLQRAADRCETSALRLLHLVVVARLHERSWAEIGAALGTSRQAAHRRFSGLVTARLKLDAAIGDETSLDVFRASPALETF